jgi:hypothetical protein
MAMSRTLMVVAVADAVGCWALAGVSGFEQVPASSAARKGISLIDPL